MATLNLKHIYQQLSTENDPVIIELFDALIDEVGRLQDRVGVLERVRDYNERTQR